MKNRKSLLASLLTLGLLVGSTSSQASGWCESGKPVKFAGLSWESGMLLTDIMKEGSEMLIVSDDAGVVEKAFGAKPVDGKVWLPGVMSRKKDVVPKFEKAFA